MKKKYVEIDRDFEFIIISAVRYACGRRTYAVGIVCDYVIRYLNYIGTDTLNIILQSIQSQRDLGYDKSLGDECDVRRWVDLEQKINEEIIKRNA